MTERLFLSWSGDRSHMFAEALYDWFPLILPDIEPWLSDHDVVRGQLWADALQKELEGARLSIICLTPENANSTWIHFEAGAISKQLPSRSSYGCTYLLGMNPEDLSGPLSTFQATIVDREPTRKLLLDIANLLESSGDKSKIRLNTLFDQLWTHLESRIRQIENQKPLTQKETAYQGIKALISSSNIPMFFADKELVIRYCNNSMAELFDTDLEAFIGKHTQKLFDTLIQRIPEKYRATTLERQKSIADKILSELAPHSEDVVIIDNRDLPGNRYQAYNQVWIHADKVRACEGSETIGLFVVYHVNPLPAVDE